MNEIKFKVVKGEPMCDWDCNKYPHKRPKCHYGWQDGDRRAECIPGLRQQRDAAQERLSRIDKLIDQRITDYAECNPCPDKAAGGALKELRHIQKMIYIINAGNKE